MAPDSNDQSTSERATSGNAGGEANETRKERVDRELTELLNELRVAIPGVQVLFAFLLTVPFSQGFTKMTSSDKLVYATALLLAAAATALLIAPSSNHRLNFRSGNKERIVKTSNRLAIGGLLALMFSMSTSVYLIMTLVFGSGVALVVAAGTIAWFSALWYALPLFSRGE